MVEQVNRYLNEAFIIYRPLTQTWIEVGNFLVWNKRNSSLTLSLP